MNNRLLSLLLATTTIFFSESHVAGGTKVPRIRGIPVSKKSLYTPGPDFQCLDGSKSIPFSQVNDDYCDCADGSDEPGTAACSNGFFYCQNLGYQAAYIPSKWVNDGVCDCCDASDEYDSNKTCVDNCVELGLEARLAAQRIAELAREGNKVRMQLIAKGKKLKADYQERLGKLRVDSEEAERTKQEKEALKKIAEEREEVAMAKYKPPVPEKPAQPQENAPDTNSEARLYFEKLDSDNSNTITVAELQTRVIFDNDRNGEVSEDEALFFLNNLNEVTWEQFITSVWPNIKPVIMLEKGLFKPEQKQEEQKESEDQHTPEHAEDQAYDDDDEDVDPEDHSQDEGQHPEEDAEGDTEPEQQEEEPPAQYDEETQSIIDEATAARRTYDEAERAVRDIQGEINRLEEKLERDYGPEEEFAALDGECFEYTDLEYIYTLCMFDRATQKSKSGGSNVSLGTWSEWVGGDKSKYSKMKYDRGLTCWNGPPRSTIVTLNCGTENKIVAVTEPSRCEYAFEFSTPAVCHTNVDENNTHDEL